jgi:hypothetical protein
LPAALPAGKLLTQRRIIRGKTEAHQPGRNWAAGLNEEDGDLSAFWQQLVAEFERQPPPAWPRKRDMPGREELPATLKRSPPKARETWNKMRDTAVQEFSAARPAVVLIPRSLSDLAVVVGGRPQLVI